MSTHAERKKPEWRTSEGRLREQSPIRNQDGRGHLTGYEPGIRERKEERPQETGRLGGSYGNVAVGISRKKELTLSVSRSRSYEGPAARREEQKYRSDGSVKVNQARADFRTNSHDKQSSAMIYREPTRKQAPYMMDRVKDLMETHHSSQLERQLPFLNQRKDRVRLQKLEEQNTTLRSKGEGRKADALERERQELKQERSEKETQERRLRLMLDRAREQAKHMTREQDGRKKFLFMKRDSLVWSEEQEKEDNNNDENDNTEEENGKNDGAVE